MTATLVLRDVHVVPTPPLWPPAPGWWLVAAALLLGGALWAWHRQRRRQRRERVAALFDEAVNHAASAPEAVAAMSELLRRAARRQDPVADRLEGEAWLGLLDRGLDPPVFDGPCGQLLLDGAFKRQVPPADVEALRRIARARFISWMLPR